MISAYFAAGRGTHPMGLTRSEQWTLCFVVALTLVGFIIQAHRARDSNDGVWIEPTSGWIPLSTEPMAGEQAGLLSPSPHLAALPSSPATGVPGAHEDPSASPQADRGARIDLNSASVSELELLPGIGPAKAKAISDYRSDTDGFSSIDQLLEVKGIGPKTLLNIRPFLALGPPPVGARPPTDLDASIAPTRSQTLDNTRLDGTYAPKVNINRADAKELQSLKGIGPVLAGRIIEARAVRPFRSAEDLLAIKGIGPVTLERIRARVTVE
jgi:competence ComEA-like helix-hairpin-helix protein